MRDRNEPIKLRDPDGNCLHQLLLERFPDQGWEFEDTPTRAPQDLPVDDRWLTSKDDLSTYAPVVEMVLILNHFEILVSGSINNVGSTLGGKQLQDALHRVMEMPRLPRLICHLGVSVDVSSMPGAVRQPNVQRHFERSVFFRMSAEASQRSRPYKVWAQW